MYCKRNVLGLFFVTFAVIYLTLILYISENPYDVNNYVRFKGLLSTYNTSCKYIGILICCILFTSVQNSRYKKNVKEQIAQIGTDSIKLTIFQIFDALKSLKKGKACGVDGLAAEHFIYAHSILNVFVSLLFNYFIVH